MNKREAVDEFLGLRRIAFAGVSRDEKHFSRRLFDEFVRRGYDIVPVNPHTADVGGRKCFASVQEITPGVEGVLVLTPAEQTESIVRDCHEAGINRIWMYRATGPGAVSQRALDFCEAMGMSVVAGECPHMFLPGNAFPHRLHGFIRKLTGSYPR